MKKILIIAITLLLSCQLSAQRNIAGIGQQMKNLEKISEKYDDWVDSIYTDVSQYIANCDAQIAVNPTVGWKTECAIWHCYMAEFLMNQSFSYTYTSSRTPGADIDLAHIDEWDGETLRQQIVLHYRKALQEAYSLRQIPFNQCKEIVQDDGDDEQSSFNTLYEFVLYKYARILQDFSQKKDHDKDKNPNIAIFLTSNEDFINLQFDIDTSSYQYEYLSVLQQLTKEQMKSATSYPLIRTTLARFHKGEDSLLLYGKALKHLEGQHRGTVGYYIICDDIGYFYSKHAESEYRDNDDFVTAMEWYNKALSINSKDDVAVFSISQIKEKCVHASFPDYVYPEPQLIPVITRNCDVVHLMVIKNPKKSNTVQPVLTTQFSISNNHHYFEDTSCFVMPELPVGDYIAFLNTQPFPEKTNFQSLRQNSQDHFYFSVNRMDVVTIRNDSTIHFFVFDFKTGEAVANASVKTNRAASIAKTDANGEATLRWKEVSENNFRELKVTISKDGESYEQTFYKPYDYSERDLKKGSIFTDREIYRPGQTVHYKFVHYSEKGYATQALSSQEIAFTLMNNEYQTVATDTLTTNEFGSCASNFQIPTTGNTGNFTISATPVNNQRKHFCTKVIRVEEYKRPQFEVEIEQPETTFKLGGEVKVSGTAKAYAGFPIQDATVTYTVQRATSFPFRCWYWWLNPYKPESTTITSGQCTTDAEGKFSINFIAEGMAQKERFAPMYRFTVTATVSDINGETHEAQTVIPISSRSLQFSIGIPDIITEETENGYSLRVLNLSGKPQATTVNYKLLKLRMPDHFQTAAPIKGEKAAQQFGKQFPQYAFNGEEDRHNWPVEKTVTTGTLQTSDSSLIRFAKKLHLENGAYRIVCSATDSYGKEIEETKDFYIAYPNGDYKIYSALEVIADKTSMEPGETVTFTIGSYLKNTRVKILVQCNDEVIEEKWIRLHQSSQTIRFTPTERQRGMVQISACLYYEGNCYNKIVQCRIKFSNKIIGTEFITFRNELEPGEKTKVKLTLKDHKSTPVNAELLCAMYDASLDAFAANRFGMSFYRDYWNSFPTFNHSYSNMSYGTVSGSHCHLYLKPSEQRFPEWKFSSNFFYGYRYPKVRSLSDSNAKRYYSKNESSLEAVEEVAAFYVSLDNGELYDVNEVRKENAALQQNQEGQITMEASGNELVAIRENFAETAFFLPFLRTDENGNIEFEYTVPESLTRWKMLGIAHTQDLSTGTFEKKLETKKPLMLVPNLPRFLYEGDTVYLSAKIVNQTESQLVAKVFAEITNAVTNERIAVPAEYATQKIEIAAEQTANVIFKLAVPYGVTGIDCILSVSASNNQTKTTFTDGEEHILPVLSRRMLLTEATPFFISKTGSKEFELDADIDKGVDITYCKLEFTPSPKWYVLTSLPYLMQYPYDCNEQIFSKLYANTMATFIAQQNPQIYPVLRQYANTTDSYNKLRQNQDVKQILLEETPWIDDAQRDDERYNLMLNLFDMNKMQEEAKKAVRKLEKNQNADGGWSWFAGGRSSLYITQHILSETGRLFDRHICTPSDKFLSTYTISKAINYMDNEVEKDFKRLKQYNPNYEKNYSLTSSDLQYLYARSYFLSNKKPNTEAYNFYVKKLVEYAKNDQKGGIYLPTMAAMTLYRLGKAEKENSEYASLAQNITLNIKKLAQHSEEMGMWWKKEGYGYYWYEAPIERQSLLIEAFETILQDYASADEMRIWLLQQKRTQSWGTTRNTVEACYAILVDNQKVAKTDKPDEIKLTFGGHTRQFTDTIQPSFSQKIYPKALNNKENRKIKLERSNDALSYGAVYYQYYQDIDEVDATEGNPLSVSRELYRVDLTDKGERLTKLGDNAQLKVGDKVCARIVIRSDRDLEFVHLKDLRAAAFEPMETRSGYSHQDGLYYYQSFRDASVNFFFDWLNKGTYVFEYKMFVTQAGTFSSGYANIQCMYSPEFTSHSKGGKVMVE